SPRPSRLVTFGVWPPSRVCRARVPHGAVLPGCVPDVAEKRTKSAKFWRLHRTPTERLPIYVFDGLLTRERTEELAMVLGTTCAYLIPGKLDRPNGKCKQAALASCRQGNGIQ